MSILNALKTSAVFAGLATVLFAGAAEAASLFDGTISTDSNSPFDTDLIDGFTETTGNTSPEIIFDAEVGDILTFDFGFLQRESTVGFFKDGASYTLNGETFLLADVTKAEDGFDVEIDTAGQNTLSFSAFNATTQTILPGFPLDAFNNEESILSIENVTISDAQAVPEPASMLGLMAVAALGSSSLLKRKRS